MANSKSYLLRIVILFLLLPQYKNSLCQSNGKIYTFSEISWTIVLPAGFKVIDDADNNHLNKKGKKAIESSTGKKVEIAGTKTLISASKNTNDYFSATITPLSSSTDNNWKTINETEKRALYKTFKDKMPTARIDTVSSKAKISGLYFDQFHLKITQEEKVLFDIYLFSKLYRGYDFGISYLCLDEQTKNQIETMLRNSKFSK